MKNSPAGLNSRFEMTEDRISELNNSSIETIKSEEKRKKDWQNEQFQRPLGQCHIFQHICNDSLRRGGEKETGRKNIWRKDSWKLSKINEKHEYTNPGSSVNC